MSITRIESLLLFYNFVILNNFKKIAVENYYIICTFQFKFPFFNKLNNLNQSKVLKPFTNLLKYFTTIYTKSRSRATSYFNS